MHRMSPGLNYISNIFLLKLLKKLFASVTYSFTLQTKFLDEWKLIHNLCYFFITNFYHQYPCMIKILLKIAMPALQ